MWKTQYQKYALMFTLVFPPARDTATLVYILLSEAPPVQDISSPK
jgi:hypothetical protein